MKGPQVILLEGDQEYRLEISNYLQSNGLHVITVETLNDVDVHLHNHEWMISLVNFGTQTDRGLEFLKANARRHKGAIMVLSDQDDPIDRIVCLELGADDGMAKSMHMREILARIRVAARRRPAQPTGIAPAKPLDIPVRSQVAEAPATAWRFNREEQELIAPSGHPIDLTADQFSLLDLLIQHAGDTLSREYLSRTLFDRTPKVGDRSIDNLVARLRRRLGEPTRGPRMIKTARAGGYFFAGFPDQLQMKPFFIRNQRKRAA